MELIDRLMPQVDVYTGRVKVLAYWNNGDPGLPEIRQRLVEAVDTDYLSFADDDDMVSHDYVSSIMTALDERPDYVGFQVRYIANGARQAVVDHSLRHGEWREEKNPYRLLRDISHINPMRSEVAKAANFRVVERGQVEDRPWVAQIRESGRLRTEVYIPDELYEYRWSRTGTRWRAPQRIRQAREGERALVHSPNFEYLDQRPAEPLRLAVIVPTRSRPENIRKVIAAWDETGAWVAADLVLAADADDPEIGGYRQIALDRFDVQLIRYPKWEPMVPKLNRAAMEVAEQRDHFAIAFAGDDHLPRTHRWAQTYLKTLYAMRTGMVYGDDGYQGAKLSTEWAVTADVVRELGRMVPAPVDHLYCDNVMMDLFGGAGALQHLPEVRIEHMHPVAGKADSDEQYLKVNSRTQYNADGTAYQNWKRSELPLQVEIIRKLRGDTAPPVRPARERTRPVRGSGPRKIERSGPSRYSAPPKSSYPFPPQFRYVIGATPDEVVFTLADLAKNVPADQEIVELGVYQARTSLIMAWGAAQGNGAHVTAVDAWDLPGNTYHPPFTDAATREQAYANVANLGYSDQVTLYHEFASVFGGQWIENREEGGTLIGLLFVDDDHSAEGVHAAFEAWAPRLAEGAVIAFDDYGHPDWPGVKQAVDELVDNGRIEAIELHHNRLAVTRLRNAPVVRTAPISAITSEGVEPAPVTDDLDSKSGLELREIAEGLGIMVKPALRKAQVIALIRSAREGAGQ